MSSEAERQFLADTADEVESMREEMRRGVERVEKAGGELLTHDQDRIWLRIEKAADAMVEKSAKPLTRERAVERFLRTDAGKRLYGEYVQAQEDARQVVAKSEARMAERGVAEWADEQLAGIVQKARAAGLDDEGAWRWACDLRPDLVKAAGVEAPTAVEKGESSWQAIERGADKIIAKGDKRLSKAQAIDQFLRTAEGARTYAEYVLELDGGRETAATVEKSGASTWARIEAEAKRLMFKQPALSHARAVARVLERDPRLYSEYLREVSAGHEQRQEPEPEPVPEPDPRAAARAQRELLRSFRDSRDRASSEHGVPPRSRATKAADSPQEQDADGFDPGEFVAAVKAELREQGVELEAFDESGLPW